MSTSIDRAAWGNRADEHVAEIEAWRRADPVATFDEMEEAVEAQLAQVRERLVGDTIQTSAQAEVGGAGARLGWPGCGGALQAKGVKRRELTTHRGGSVEIERTYGHCPRGDAGLVPPGSGT